MEVRVKNCQITDQIATNKIVNGDARSFTERTINGLKFPRGKKP